MKTKTGTNKLISALLAMAVMFGLFAAFPLTAFAADTTMDISDVPTGPMMVATIQKGIQNVLNTASSGDTITITGSKTGISSKLTLNIPSGVTVIWKAKYEGNVSDAMIELTGSGTFEVVKIDANNIRNQGDGNCILSKGANASITINGGSVFANKTALRIEGQNSTVKVINFGSLTSNSGDVLCVVGSNAKITVSSGGGVRCQGSVTGSAIYISSASVDTSVTVMGNGYVNTEATTGYNHAICSDGANTHIQVDGVAQLRTKGEYATIYMRGSNPTVQLTGGYVFGTGTDLLGEKNVIYMSGGSPTITSDGIVCAWNKPSETPITYVAGSSTDLKVNADVTATWTNDGFPYITCKTATDIVRQITMGGVNIVASPVAPSNLTATAGAGGIKLTWKDNSSNETGFIIERKGDGAGWGQMDYVEANTTTYTDTNVQAGKTYTYKVNAVISGTSGAVSGYSNEATATMGSASTATSAPAPTSTPATSTAPPESSASPPTVTQYDVTFKYDNGQPDWVQTVNAGDKVDCAMDDPIKNENIFAGWYKDTELTQAYDFDTPVTANITLCAKWVPAQGELTPNPDGEDEGGFNWLWIALIALLLVAAGGGLAFVIISEKEKGQKKSSSQTFCGNCGTRVQAGMKFCPECGGQIGAMAQQNNTEE